jgi:hypothetical protein
MGVEPHALSTPWCPPQPGLIPQLELPSLLKGPLPLRALSTACLYPALRLFVSPPVSPCPL